MTDPGTTFLPFRPGLGRHVNHDPRSRRFPYVRAAAASFRPATHVQHDRYVPIFDQGDLGKCTAETALGLLGTGPYWDALRAIAGGTPTSAGIYPFTDAGTNVLYSDITRDDPFDGQWPPDDTGSDGLSMAKALVRAGIVPGYQHTFSLGDALRALVDYPLAVGTLWTDRMFTPNRSGLITYDGAGHAVGGHEWIADGYDTERNWVRGVTSWGTSWGLDGRFYLTVEDFGRLLADDGDVIVLTPPTASAPLPDIEIPVVPVGDPDREFAAAIRTWLTARGL